MKTSIGASLELSRQEVVELIINHIKEKIKIDPADVEFCISIPEPEDEESTGDLESVIVHVHEKDVSKVIDFVKPVKITIDKTKVKKKQ